MEFFQRVFGVLSFRSSVYRSIAGDEKLNIESSVIVIIISLLNSFLYTWINGFSFQSVLRFLSPLLSWLFFGWFCAWTADTFFKVKIPTANMLRVLAHTRIFSIFGIIALNFYMSSSFILFPAVWIGIIADIFGVRQTSDLSNGQAIIIYLLGILITTLPFRFVFGT